MDRTQLLTILARSECAGTRAIITLYARQTADEQGHDVTRHRNGMGFNATDASFLSSLARQVEAGRRLSRAQLTAARRALPKYAAQLLASGVDWAALDAQPGAELRAMEALAVELNGGAAP